MTKNKKRVQTPRRKSARKRERTLKGQYYDEHINEFTSETHVTGSLDITPPIASDLDTTRAIEDRLLDEEGFGGASGSNDQDHLHVNDNVNDT